MHGPGPHQLLESFYNAHLPDPSAVVITRDRTAGPTRRPWWRTALGLGGGGGGGGHGTDGAAAEEEPWTTTVLNPATDWQSVRRQFWTTGIVTLDDVLSPTAAATLKDELLMRTLYTKVRAAYVEAAPATLCVQCSACARVLRDLPGKTLHAPHVRSFLCPHADTHPTAGSGSLAGSLQPPSCANAARGGAGSRAAGRLPWHPPGALVRLRAAIGAPCTQCPRHRDPIHKRKGLTCSATTPLFGTVLPAEWPSGWHRC
jgi:hypothetical protein